MSGYNSSKQTKARDLKHRVLTCIHKLSDRDTHSAAASELESIAKTLSGESLPPFLSSISATDSSDKSPVRRQCVRLISVLSEHHGNSLSPYLSKVLTAIVRRLRDPDSSVRAACVAASLSLSSHLTSPPFTSITKPFLEALFVEQDFNAQTGVALCLAAVIEGSRNPDAGSLRRLLPRLEKLAKSESFKAKAAVLSLIGSLVEVKGVLSDGGKNVTKNLVMRLMEFLSSEDWAARKAAAEALMKIAAVEKQALLEYKETCLKTFEAKKFDKVKAARETMNQMIEVWKEIPDLPDQVSQLPESEASSKENASDGRYPPGSKAIGSCTTQIRRRSLAGGSPASKAQLPDGSPVSTSRKRSPLWGNDNKIGTAMFRKLDRKKPSDVKIEIVSGLSEDTPSNHDERLFASVEREKKQSAKPDVKRALFNEDSGKQKLGFFRGGSRVVPCGDVSVVVSNETGDAFRGQRESDDLSLIRKQLLHIENQQSNLFELLQRFMGSSQSGMHSLEARVHGLELALDEISYDLAVSTGRMSKNSSATMCWKLPGSDFLSSKLWRKAEARRSSTSLLPPSVRGNPLARISSGFPEVSSSGVCK